MLAQTLAEKSLHPTKGPALPYAGIHEVSDSHFCCGVLWGSHPGTIFEPLAELLVDLDSRVWRCP